MPRKLQGFDFRPARARGEQDWEKLLNGETWELIQGSDFFGSVQNMRALVYQAAARRKLKVRTAQSGRNLVVKAEKGDS